MAKGNRLGKGLSAIIAPKRNAESAPATSKPAAPKPQPETKAAPTAPTPPAKPTAAVVEATQPAATPPPDPNAPVVHSLHVDKIIPNRNQPRSVFDEQALGDLSDSIARQGVLQPIVVRPEADGKYELIAGERRWRAARAAGLDEIPALVKTVTDEVAVELALVENLQREDLNAMERAFAYDNYLRIFARTPEELAVRLGESRANVSNYLRLLTLAPEVQQLVESGDLSMGHARALAGLDDPRRQVALARMAVRRNLSVRQVEAMARPEPVSRETSSSNLPSKHLEDVQRSLSKSLGLNVSLQPGRRRNSGKVVIKYGSLDEFDRIAERLSGGAALE